ncbi:hypothetical protein CK203_043910 [Vitis vinifera]|uniref:Uncharacterized protein n=1 Tax=Vitis vinifera TaxID=29760 RepID=A0A438HVG9_VITVI|nr:hypothetical protein CK203_043910 [Vitis vinifera]
MFGLRLQGGGGGGKGVDVPHLLFANSTLLFCIPYSGQLTYMSWIPQWFKASAERVPFEIGHFGKAWGRDERHQLSSYKDAWLVDVWEVMGAQAL